MKILHVRLKFNWHTFCFLALQILLLVINTANASTPMITTGAKHTCSLSSDGAVQCWGDNTYGQLGNGNTSTQKTPTTVSGLTIGVSAIAAGANHTCAITNDGALRCWGNNDSGQLGDNSTTIRTTPVVVSGLISGVVRVVAGIGHTCAITSATGVKCWGNNFNGQLGDGSTTNRLNPVDVSGLVNGVSSVAAGGIHTCALTTASSLKCWGNNSYGQLGDGSTFNRQTPVNVIGFDSGVNAIYTGGGSSCALTSVGEVKCWGNNASGQLGDNSITNRVIPVGVIGLAGGVSSIATGDSNTCALTSDGGVKCWGDNFFGQLGDGGTTGRLVPVNVIGLTTGVIAISTGYDHTCALTVSGGVKCWGHDDMGQLGDGGYNNTIRLMPWGVRGLANGIKKITMGGAHTCALNLAGGVQCWGSNQNGELGDGTTIDRNVPVDVSGLTNGVIAISAAGSHTCAITAGGGVKCWGSNSNGILGDGTLTSRNLPVDAIGLTSGVRAISVSLAHVCAVTISGGVKCWGYNYNDMLGVGGSGFNQLTPANVIALPSGISSISAGYFHSCAITDMGSVKCWGQNYYGALGNGTTIDSSSPVNVNGLTSDASEISASFSRTCALTKLGGVKCWGQNWGLTPVDLSGLTNGISAIELSAMGTNMCKLTTGGGVSCWGNNSYGQLGDGTTIDRMNPTDVSGLTSGVTQIAVGDQHTCAVTLGGGAKCWGSNSAGELGDGTAMTRPLASLFVNGLVLFNNTVLLSSPSQSVRSQSVTFTLSVVGLSPTGTVNFNFGDGSTTQTVPLVAGLATVTHSFNIVGSFSVKATYSGDNDNPESAKTWLQVVNPAIGEAAPICLLTASPSSVSVGLTSTLAATCNPAANAYVWTGGTCADRISATCVDRPATTTTYTVAGINEVGTGVAALATVTVTDPTAHLTNISTRGPVQTGNDTMIGGFVIAGPAAKTVLIRAIGPTLSNFGIANVLADPTLAIYSGSSAIAANNDWGSAANAAAVQATGLAPSNPLESAILTTLRPGPYTAIVAGSNGGTGVGMVEVYEVDHPEYPLINISTRGQVQTGNNVMIGGFIVQGNAPQTVLIRAVGPNLANFGVTGVLANPTLTLYSGQLVIATNDDWGSASNAAAVQATGLAPANPLESAILISLPPGAYTAVVSGVGGGTGVGIVEVFAQ